MTNSINGLDGAQELLIKLVEQNPADWETRKKVVQVLYDAAFYRDASKMVWSAPEIPPVGEEVIFAAQIVSKGQPSRAMRLFDTVIEKNLAHPEENLAMAKLLVKASMPHQAIRFYGAATALDSSLIDENFELSLVSADAEGKSWSNLVTTEAFPWDGPQDLVKVEEEEKAETYAELLNGATQPVPMKAPVREKVERRNELPNWKVEKKKTSSFSQEILEQEVVSIETPKEVVAEKVASDLSDSKPAAERETKVPELVKVDQLEVSEMKSEKKSSSSFFKSYDAAHEHTHETKSEMKSGAPAVHPPSQMAKIEPKPEPAREPEAIAAVEPVGAIQEPTQKGFTVGKNDDALANHVSDTLASMDETSDEVEEQDDIQIGNIKSRMTGAFSSLVKKMRRKPSEEREPVLNVDELDLSGVEEISSGEVESPRIESAPAPLPTEVVAPLPIVAKSEPVVQKAPVPRPITQLVSEVAKPESNGPSVPKELDGRTQLVSLAPEDGTAFFNELRTQYSTVQRTNLPRPAVIARDMANLDYVMLINKACDKDVDAFSKLLGLHRVMHSAGCGEWVADMNSLRKGYGDAVLATVVSKYSVTECREILNSVYTTPTSQAAAV